MRKSTETGCEDSSFGFVNEGQQIESMGQEPTQKSKPLTISALYTNETGNLEALSLKLDQF